MIHILYMHTIIWFYFPFDSCLIVTCGKIGTKKKLKEFFWLCCVEIPNAQIWIYGCYWMLILFFCLTFSSSISQFAFQLQTNKKMFFLWGCKFHLLNDDDIVCFIIFLFSLFCLAVYCFNFAFWLFWLIVTTFLWLVTIALCVRCPQGQVVSQQLHDEGGILVWVLVQRI